MTIIQGRHSQSFLTYLVGQAVSSVGDGVYLVAFMWLSLELSGGKGVVVGSVFSVYTLTELIFGLIAGPIVDHSNRRKILIMVDLARGSVLCIFYLVLRSGTMHLLFLYGCSFLFAMLSPFFHRAEFAILPELVCKNELLRANGLLSGSKRIMRIVSPLVGGVLIHLFSIQTIFLFDAISFFFSVLCISLIAIDERKRTLCCVKFRCLISDIKNGFIIVLHSSLLLTLTIYAACINFVGAPVFPLLSIISEKTGNGASGYGLMVSVLSAGLVVSNFLVIFMEKIFSRTKIMLIGICVSSVGVMIIAMGYSILTIAPACFLIGMGLTFANLPILALLQEKITSDKIGVVSSFVFTTAQIAMPISMAFSGFITELFGVTFVLGVLGMLMLMGAIIGFFLPPLRRTA